MRRVAQKQLPDGMVMWAKPFHVSMEGLETVVLCRDDEDYDAMVKILCISAKRKNVIIIIYAVVSNHCHIAVLACSQEEADAYGAEVKRMYSMWFSRKYGARGMMKSVEVKAIYLENDWHVRNALAYIPRNALDNGCNVNEYRWSGYRAMFGTDSSEGVVRVASLTKRQRLEIMHTGEDLRDVLWMLDKDGCLVPSSFCDHSYLEQVFENDQAFFMKVLGGQNAAEMKNTLIDLPRKMRVDSELLKSVEDICKRWFATDLAQLSMEKKIRIIPYVYRTMRTTVPQLSRIFGIEREQIAGILGKVELYPGDHSR